MNYTILAATRSHLPYLPSIEKAAEILFPIEDLPASLRSINTSLDDLKNAQQHDLLWVAVDESNIPIAFLLADIIDDCLHIAEFDVHPDYGNRGIGTELLKYVLLVANQRSFPAVILTTFEHLPWNAPFYSHHSFEILSDNLIGTEFTEIRKQEEISGLKRRVAMILRLKPNPTLQLPIAIINEKLD
jgi:GNAT superfamily N-acetyltransferase